MQNYELFIKRIAEAAKLDVEEVDRRVEAKKAKLSGLISKEGAAQIIAAELGINFEDQNLKISELASGMRKANVLGKIINLFPVREFEKNGRSGKVANFVLADETGTIRVVLWDINHIALIENEEIKQGDCVEIKNASVRDGEIHLSGFSEIKKSDESFENVKTEEDFEIKSLKDIRQSQRLRSRATVVQLFPPRFYFVCPECNRKVVSEEDKFTCAEHGEVKAKDRAILNFVIDDGTEATRVVMFSDQINQLINEADLKNPEKFQTFSEDFLGSEVYVEGIVKRNQLFNNLEIIASKVEKAELEKLIAELEA